MTVAINISDSVITNSLLRYDGIRASTILIDDVTFEGGVLTGNNRETGVALEFQEEGKHNIIINECTFKNLGHMKDLSKPSAALTLFSGRNNNNHHHCNSTELRFKALVKAF